MFHVEQDKTMALSESLEAQTRREVASIVCPVCQREKRSGQPLCARCYHVLSGGLKKELNTLTGLDYACAFDESKDFVRLLS